jgi:hypothetical protein
MHLIANDADEKADPRADCVSQVDGHRLEQQEAKARDGHEEVQDSLRVSNMSVWHVCMYRFCIDEHFAS